MRRWLTLAILFGVVLGTTLQAQDPLSVQVLRLLTRANEWTGLQTFDRGVGLRLERASLHVADPTDILENIGGSLYFNGVLVVPTGGVGTVTSVGLSMPGVFSVASSPVTSSGTIAVTLATQTANRVWAGPTTGSAAAPTFRALVAADLPAVPASGITGTVPVANGGTGITSGTSGGILGFTATGTLASSALLADHGLVLGEGAGATPTTLTVGTTNTVLHGNTGADPTWALVSLTADVTGTLPITNGGLGLTGGTSGGVLYFSGAATLASSAALTANRLVLGGGAGTAPTVLGSLGTTTTLLHGNAGGAPTFGAVALANDVSGTLPATNGGSGFASYTVGDLLQASTTTALAKLAAVATGNVLISGGVGTVSSWGKVGLTTHVSGVLDEANGGNGADASAASNGTLFIGTGSGLTLTTLTGTADQVVVTNGSGSITLSTPQSINTTSTPRFARLGLGTGAGATAVLTTTGTFDVGYVSDGNCGAADTIDFSAGMQHTSTLNAATCTYTFSNPLTGAPPYLLVVVQDGTGGRLVSWPVTIKWKGNAAPTLSTDPNAVDVCRFLWNGTNYYGECDLNFQ